VSAAGASDDRARTISVGPLSMTIQIADWDRFVKTAKPGAKIVYAEGPAAPRSDATFIRARAAFDAGQVLLFTAKGPRGHQWIAERRAEGARGREMGRHKATIVRADDQSPEQRLFSYLKRCANFAMPCPTNEEINAAIDVRNGKYLFRKLIEAGLIRSEDQGPNRRRRVTIVATGLFTRDRAL
jgi:hypothetical protein